MCANLHPDTAPPPLARPLSIVLDNLSLDVDGGALSAVCVWELCHAQLEAHVRDYDTDDGPCDFCIWGAGGGGGVFVGGVKPFCLIFFLRL